MFDIVCVFSDRLGTGSVDVVVWDDGTRESDGRLSLGYSVALSFEGVCARFDGTQYRPGLSAGRDLSSPLVAAEVLSFYAYYAESLRYAADSPADDPPDIPQWMLDGPAERLAILSGYADDLTVLVSDLETPPSVVAVADEAAGWFEHAMRDGAEPDADPYVRLIDSRECDACGGSGKRVTVRPDWQASQTCDRCLGSGRISIEPPAWVRDMVRAAHGDMLPDDWKYSAIRAAVDAIAELDTDTEPDDIDDARAEYCDSQVDVYTGSRLAWLSSNLTRSGYCDDAASDGLVSESADIVDRIGAGQYAEADEVWGVVLGAIRDEWEERQ